MYWCGILQDVMSCSDTLHPCSGSQDVPCGGALHQPVSFTCAGRMAQVRVLCACAYVSTCMCNRFACVCARARMCVRKSMQRVWMYVHCVFVCCIVFYSSCEHMHKGTL